MASSTKRVDCVFVEVLMEQNGICESRASFRGTKQYVSVDNVYETKKISDVSPFNTKNKSSYN